MKVPWTAEKIQAFRKTLLAWYDTHGRDLPWRRSQEPYHIWVSEIMLQQTQVNTVIPYYERFITELPTIQALAEAPEEQLLTLWQGLGFYRRVKNMQIAAQQVVDHYGGELPASYEELLTLRGIGPYTAGAIASIAFKLPEPALDGNLMRVITRLFELDWDISKQKNQRKLRAIVSELIDPTRPGDFNQALMDIGATIMTPSNTNIEASPLKAFDQSYHNGTAQYYPVNKAKIKVSHHYYLAYFIQNEKGEFLIRQHEEGELLQDLWHFPLVERDIVMEAVTLAEVVEPLQEHYELEEASFQLAFSKPISQLAEELPSLTHIFSHRHWTLQLIPLKVSKNAIQKPALKWITPEEIGSYPYSALQEKLYQQTLKTHLIEK